MDPTNIPSENEIKSLLEIVLKNEKLNEISVNIQGSTEKGDGYMGDIIFVSVQGTTDNYLTKSYDLVLKCSKKSENLRKTSPVKEVFLNEIFMYTEVLPQFIQFQKDKQVAEIFNNVPKCYGYLTTENSEVIVLENLKIRDYELWPRKHPLSRKHIDMVVTQYGRYHATSLAFSNQRPTEFQKLLDTIVGVFDNFVTIKNMQSFFGTVIDATSDLLKNDLDENTLRKWKGLKDQIHSLYEKPLEDLTGVKVILHGDCWNNNFMYLHEKDEEKVPLNVVFLDWQVSRFASPIMDLSYFLFSCLSEGDFQDLDHILTMYHNSFIDHLGRLGTENPNELYPLKQFFNEWKCYSRYGIMSASFIMKVVCTDKDEAVDIAEEANSGRDFTQTFQNEIRDKENHKRRVKPIVECAVKCDLI